MCRQHAGLSWARGSTACRRPPQAHWLFDDVRVRVVTDELLTASGDPDRLFANVNTSTEYRAIEANGMQS